MVNVNKLKGAIVEHGMNIEILADKIGMDKSTFYRRMQANGDTFTLKEASDIVSALGLTAEEGTQIFFPKKSHKRDFR